ncbi:hypothetical protein PHABIO_451 [Pseudomonas phage Phabio]|uniref:Uncharacterized protein n=1 Tax=Pseudomonas phage Phabio TaxID=2006668 RepID=A0A1Y0SUP0_9CAUD|nr:hypothetical protein MZD05_gp467 [Pseudomonas phage Phabio]ARV77080.1 hypothetical protein PHABIO_451 [Pseudomonas phage Phabio]
MSEIKEALVKLSERWVDESLTHPTPPDECIPLEGYIPSPVREAMLKRFSQDQFGNSVK